MRKSEYSRTELSKLRIKLQFDRLRCMPLVILLQLVNCLARCKTYSRQGLCQLRSFL